MSIMTDEQMKRVHDITYSTEDREELAERIVALEDENASLRDEKMLLAMDKLGIGVCYDNLSAQYKELESENVKLRELVLDLYDAIDSVFWDGEFETRERFEPRMSELGIEVEE